jgi:hypothetical protein
MEQGVDVVTVDTVGTCDVDVYASQVRPQAIYLYLYERSRARNQDSCLRHEVSQWYGGVIGFMHRYITAISVVRRCYGCVVHCGNV